MNKRGGTSVAASVAEQFSALQQGQILTRSGGQCGGTQVERSSKRHPKGPTNRALGRPRARNSYEFLRFPRNSYDFLRLPQEPQGKPKENQ